MNEQNALWRRMPSATQAVAAIQSGSLIARDLHEQCVAREALQLDAWVDVACWYECSSEPPGNDRSYARNAEFSRFHESDYPVGQLARIPVGIKDIIDLRTYWPTLAGCSESKTPYSCWEPEQDAPIVARLRSANPIFMGKTVTCQYACFDPAPTLNPWNSDRTPGGSSAGSAAAVAAGQCLIALGTQTGGSIIRPASYCGVCGFKPAHDPKWLEGVIPVSGKLDHVGPIARCVADLELAWSVVVDQKPPEVVYHAPRFGLLRDYFWEHASADLCEAIDAAVNCLHRYGAVIRDVPLPPHWDSVHAHHRTIMAYDCARHHAARFESDPQHFQPQISGLIREGLSISPDRYALAVAAQRQFREELLGFYFDIDALLMPATTTTAPTRETTGDPRFQSPWSFAGVPAVCFPSGLASDGMPCGLQLVRPHGLTHEDEFALLAVAKWCEEALAVDLWPELNKRLEKQFPNTQWIDGPC